MEDLQKYTAAVKAATDTELRAMIEANRGMVAVLALQTLGVDALQQIAIREMRERIERRAANAAGN